ncbi:hypothetical protein [Sphingobacterium multivorum]|uniref:Uncharacterized protein n=1 Tax=Sphingobacterium multivorum TaxID=28454 RepID=A0A654CZU2_SPHMU|nr:hypothetical protein [Sphingobacterium multivorum]VXC99104.1 conserved hypothetical protein [Sphingobacterium multivorum]
MSWFLRKVLYLIMPKSNENFQIVLGGDGHEIDVNTLLVTLSHLNTIVAESNRVLSGGHRDVELKVVANREGSFIIDLTIAANSIGETLKMFFNEKTVSYSSNLITTVGGIYALSKFLKGKKAKEIEKTDGQTVNVTNNNGELKVIKSEVVNVYLDSPKVIQAVSQTMKSLEADESVDSFNFVSKEEKVTIDRNLFDELANDEKILVDDVNIKKMSNVVLTIVSPDFDFKSKWQCYFAGEKKSFTVSSDALKNEVINNGLKFGVGDSINVDIEIKQEFDPKYNSYVNKGFTIVDYHSFIPKPNQSKLDLK